MSWSLPLLPRGVRTGRGAGAPDGVPLLSRGRHRGPRQGACFMELASHLAGEPWSDHPACTHPLLAAVARDVNDRTSDAARPLLLELVPSVVGSRGEDPWIDVRIARLAAVAALPVVAEERQRVLAVGLLSTERVAARLAGGAVRRDAAVAAALRQAPGAERWAERFARLHGQDADAAPAQFRRVVAPRIVACATEGIARACVPDADRRLRELLTAAIEACAARPQPRAASAPVAAREHQVPSAC
ncbi:hypothetical protein GTQ99_17895 [Kineococcus sp. T13]|uniref:hypothetical protein n=1 Tax=Kineococcus vitellinus TaxID=2696565 RepID=UPI00141320BF|nr:hypothetical protein [Kineococcus vitellinus]NAZ77279.1 hypothetical protein [Kineococcus vitellinus]